MPEETLIPTVTPDANILEKTLEKAGDIVGEILTLPEIVGEITLLQGQVLEIQGRLFALGIVELFLVIAVVYLLYKNFKK